MPISTHPRTRQRLAVQPEALKDALRFHAPFGFNHYVKLQESALIVLSDSGTVSEESSLLGFPAVTLSDSIERPEPLEMGAVITAGVEAKSILDAVAVTMDSFRRERRLGIPAEYTISDSTRRVVNFIRSTAHIHLVSSGIRGGPVR